MRALIKENEIMFEACTKFISFLESGHIKAYIPSVILAEIAWNLKSPYQFKHATIAKTIVGILKIKNLKVIDDLNPNQAIKLYTSTNLKFTDALIASSQNIQTGQAVIVSYDRDFDKIPRLKRLEPQDVI